MQQPDDTNRREDILKAALRVFAKHGFHKASIKQIAVEAKLKSPSLIYWYYKDKEALLEAALSFAAPMMRMLSQSDPLMDEPPETVLAMITQGYFSAFSNPESGNLLRVFMSEALHNPDTAQSIAHNLLPVIDFFTRYLQHQIDLGRLRPHDVQSSARAFMGTMVIYMLGKEVLTPLGEAMPPHEQYGREIIEIFLRGLRS